MDFFNKLSRRSKSGYVEGKSRIHHIGLSCNELPPEKYGGIEVQITNLAKEQVRKGYEVFCYAPGKLSVNGAYHYQTLKKVSLGPKEGKFVPNTVEHLNKVVEGLLQNYSDKLGDVINVHHSQHYPHISKMLRRKAPSINFQFIECTHWLDTGMNKNIIFPSVALKKELRKPGVVVPEGIDFENFFPEKKDIGEYILCAGRITKDKGVDIAIEAADKAGIEIKIAGPTPNKKFSNRILDNKNVTYLGELNHSELRILFSNAKALMYMTQYIEPGGAAVVEAMGCGCPIITTGMGATGETVVDGKTGYFAEDSDDIVKALNKIDSISADACVKRAHIYSTSRRADSILLYYREVYA